MDEKQFSVIGSKLDSILKLLAFSTVQGKSLKEQVSLLSSIGFQPKEIADLLGKTPNHIGVVLHEVRKSKKQVLEQETKQINPAEEKPND